MDAIGNGARAIALVGPAGAGKTSVAEALLHAAGAIPRLGSVDAGTTQGDASPEAAFLRDVRDGACDWFDIVLGPDYNAAHADHFHFDRGGGRICR